MDQLRRALPRRGAIRVAARQGLDDAIRALFRRSFGADPPLEPLHFVAEVDGYGVSGYVHYIPQTRGAFLCGGLCVDPRCYRHMGVAARAQVRREGSVSRVLLRESIASLEHKSAVFAYTGHPTSVRDALELGFELVSGHRYLYVLWFTDVPEEQARLVAAASAIGPF